MKQVGLFLCCIFILFFAHAQNVGIGNPAPAEKLDVNGNINVTGTIKANGIDGAANQVLMKNGSGTMVWGDMCEYKNIFVFATPGSTNWTIPPGVTKVWVEAWGGGAGGNWYGGGGGGGYVSGIINVVPGNSIGCVVGAGGSGGGFTSGNGNNSSISYSPIGLTLTAYGGYKTTFTAPAMLSDGYGGNFGSSVAFDSYWGKNGEAASFVRTSGFQYNATTFIEQSTGGNGGSAGNTVNTGGKAGFYTFNTTTSTMIRLGLGSNGIFPGGGGGSGYAGLLSSLGNSNGNAGAKGVVFIHY